jgi:hypothetical protein
MLRAIVIATAIGLAAPSDAQVRIITGDVEHVYGPRGEILDSPELRAKNQRAKRQMSSEERVAGPVEQQSWLVGIAQTAAARGINSFAVTRSPAASLCSISARAGVRDEEQSA